MFHLREERKSIGTGIELDSFDYEGKGIRLIQTILRQRLNEICRRSAGQICSIEDDKILIWTSICTSRFLRLKDSICSMKSDPSPVSS